MYIRKTPLQIYISLRKSLLIRVNELKLIENIYSSEKLIPALSNKCLADQIKVEIKIKTIDNYMRLEEEKKEIKAYIASVWLDLNIEKYLKLENDLKEDLPELLYDYSNKIKETRENVDELLIQDPRLALICRYDELTIKLELLFKTQPPEFLEKYDIFSPELEKLKKTEVIMLLEENRNSKQKVVNR